MKKEKEIVIISAFMGFAIGVLTMIMVTTPPGEQCYDIIEEIEFKVCEECWYNVFDGGKEYQEVKDYITWE